MSQDSTCYSYGPVPSRRLGRSLGINNIPPKICSYSCVYCQVGRTLQIEHDRRSFYDPTAILADVRNRLEAARSAGEHIDYLAFVPDGEPTLDLHLGTEIELLKELSIPVAVITNASLLWRKDVRDDLAAADWVSVKIDAASEDLWRRINRPHKALLFPRILDGIVSFAETYQGELVTETMIVSGVNDKDENIRHVAEFVRHLEPSHAYLSVPTRPPAESWIESAPDDAALRHLHSIFTGLVPVAECLARYEGDHFVSTGDFASDLLGITAVHPMRKEAVHELITRTGASWDLVEQLISAGDLIEKEYAGRTFYVRRHMR